MNLKVTMPLPPPALRGNSRVHWSEKHRVNKAYMELAWVTLREEIVRLSTVLVPFSWPVVAIIYTGYYSSKPLDHDGLIIGMKPFMDALVKLGVITDDSPQIVRQLTALYGGQDERGMERVEVEIREIRAGG